MGVTGTELEALEVIGKQGGSTTTSVVANRLGITPEYGLTLCTYLGRQDYIDLSGRQCKITDKGRDELDRKGLLDDMEDSPGLAGR